MTQKPFFVTLRNDVPGGSLNQLILMQLDDGTYQIVGVVDPDNPDIKPVTVSGLALSTLGVTDDVDTRFMLDIEQTALQLLRPIAATLDAFTDSGALLIRLAHETAVDLNAVPASVLLTVPALTSYVITHIIIREASTSLTTVEFSIGWTTPAFADVIANAGHAELIDATGVIILIPIAGAMVGAAADELTLLCNVLQGAPATVTVDIYGFLL